MTTKTVLCVCAANMLRSPTAANILWSVYGYDTRSAGIANYALIPVTDALLTWADEIVCMEGWMESLLHEMLINLGISRKVVCLSIPDDYDWNDSVLKKEIIDRYERIALGK